MKKQLALAIAAALYSAGTMAAMSTGPEGHSQLKPATISSKPIKLNTHLNRLAKFKADPNDDGRQQNYIIRLTDPAVPSFDAGMANVSSAKTSKAFQVQKGPAQRKLNLNAAPVKAYRAELDSKQTRFLDKANRSLGTGLDVKARTQLAMNAIVVKATQDQMLKLAALPEVAGIYKDEWLKMETATTYDWIGASAVWDGSANGTAYQGEGMVVGILDSGVDTTSRSFAAEGDDGYLHTNPYGDGVYLGDCETDAALCNAKLVGVYSWPAITDLYNGERPANGQDYNGHGSHTAGTAAGNVLFDVPMPDANGAPGDFSFGQVAGMAPHANIISYQTCGPGDPGEPDAGCPTSLNVLAIEQAILDGVDVINYSISAGDISPWNDSVALAYLNARAAGIHVAASGGNSGPDASTVSGARTAPWLTSVAALSHDRSFEARALTLSGGDTAAPAGILGNSITGELLDTAIVYAGDFANPNDPGNDPAQCLQPFPAGTFNGEIVLCDRGSIARVAKGQNVAAGGAGGFILANLQDGATSIAADPHVIPALHISADDGDAVKTWLASGNGHTASIPATDQPVSNPALADIMAAFSSRGPSTTMPNLLIPQVGAPGLDVFAAYAPDTPFKDNPDGTPFAFLQGTSMASPHVAGAMALIAGSTDWTPAEVQSALMLTATQAVRKEDGSTPADFFDMGAGRIQVDKAINSPLIMSESIENYVNADPAAGGDPTTVNMAAMMNGECIGSCSWTRTVTATADGSFTLAGTAISDGMSITVEPTSFTLTAGASQTLTVTADVFDAPSNAWAFGNLELDNGVDVLRMPIIANASTGNLPDQVRITANRDADTMILPDITTVAITDFTVTSYGLTKATLSMDALPMDSDGSDVFDDVTDGTMTYLVPVAEGSKRLVAEILSSDSPDLDLWLGLDANEDGVAQPEELIDFSATATALERVELRLPDAGTYWVLVQNWSSAAEGSVDAYTLASAVVDGTTGDNLTAEGPQMVGALESFDLQLSWDDDMDQGDVFYGAVELGTDADNEANLGMMAVDLVRDTDAVNLVANLADGQAMAGDTVGFSVNFLPNMTAMDRTYQTTIEVPAELTLDEASLPEGASLDGNLLTLPDVTMVSELGVPPSFNITTNELDASCQMPDYGQGGGYLDWESFPQNFRTNSALSGDGVIWNWPRSHRFMGEQYDSLYFGDDGFITFGDQFGAPFVNQELPDQEAPNAVLAYLWRDGVINYDEALNHGVTLINDDSNGNSFIEIDNLSTYYADPEVVGALDELDVSIAIMGSAGPGPEIMVAFDNVVHDFGNALGVTIGYEDATGTSGGMSLFHPFPDGREAVTIGDITSDVVDGRIICFDELGPTPTTLGFSATVDPAFAGGPIAFVLTSDSNDPATREETNDMAGLFQVDAMPVLDLSNSDITARENSLVTLVAEASDPNGDELSYSWVQTSGPTVAIENADMAEATIMTPLVGSDLVLGFQVSVNDGTHEVTGDMTVTVVPNQAPSVTLEGGSVRENDSFTLTAMATDGNDDVLSYSWVQLSGPSVVLPAVINDSDTLTFTAPEVSGEEALVFEVTVNDGMAEATASATVTVTNRSSGGGSSGSLGWLVFLLAPLTLGRRRG